MGYYNNAQVCLNGHVVTTDLSSELREKFCSRCGATTINLCQNCQAIIRGSYMVPGVISIGGHYEPPAFCYNCGEPYPWTKSALIAAEQYTSELDNLTPEERDLLSKSINDIIRETPNTSLAATRYKKLVAKAGKTSAEVLERILIGVLSETAKKLILGS